jgi:hypothetical protein
MAIRKAADRVRGLYGNLHPKKLTVLATWLCTTSGALAVLAAPKTMPEMNTEVAILGLGVAITIALTSNPKND